MYIFNHCPGGGIGRHTRLKILRSLGVPVQVRPRAFLINLAIYHALYVAANHLNDCLPSLQYLFKHLLQDLLQDILTPHPVG